MSMDVYCNKTQLARAIGILQVTMEVRLRNNEIVWDALNFNGQPLFLADRIPKLREIEDRRKFSNGITTEVYRTRERNTTAGKIGRPRKDTSIYADAMKPVSASVMEQPAGPTEVSTEDQEQVFKMSYEQTPQTP